MPTVPAFGKLKQEDSEFKASLGYEQGIVSKQKDPKVHYSFLRTFWAPAIFC